MEPGGKREEGRGQRALGQRTQHGPQLPTSTVAIPQLSLSLSLSLSLFPLGRASLTKGDSLSILVLLKPARS